MDIQKKDSSTLVITGNIKSIRHSQMIRESVEQCLRGGVKSIHLIIEDSFSMTSTVIGFLMKIINEEGVKVSMTISDHRLWQLLNDFQLIEMFRVQEKSSSASDNSHQLEN
ncbi:hypothetical protein LGV61_05575 [Desulfurispirillum indicum]|uniref:STAS domain-containing protein n=1 Tax=Desulfurispirillum indicum (strain ATCC BAA-1389 / DSM 22839 / S5) TaxID=653733 RepID=E6W3U0_DESIS|nr:hypothetical protein [Desulfurispirillum indicum]ADU65808.1 hypothetical protein Selin_1073 [Desulfurispirillum indicum S5]UCZ57744.1 hypothetical protein LGV61_05575 [Desulfurispirillum indicum]